MKGIFAVAILVFAMVAPSVSDAACKTPVRCTVKRAYCKMVCDQPVRTATKAMFKESCCVLKCSRCAVQDAVKKSKETVKSAVKDTRCAVKGMMQRTRSRMLSCCE